MSKWVRGIYNATANFNLSNALRSASGRFLGGNSKQLREECVKSNECKQSSESSESNCTAASCTASASSSTRTTACSSGTSTCSGTASTNGKTRSIPAHVSGCICSLCRDYDDYNEYSASVRTEGQGASARIRASNEPRNFKQSNSDATSSVERVTGIPTGVTI